MKIKEALLNTPYHCRSAEVNMIKPYESMCCGSPKAYVCMWFNTLDVRLTFGDDDDYDASKIYICKNEHERMQVFNELVNYLHDIENQAFDYAWIYDGIAFPDLGVPTKWEFE